MYVCTYDCIWCYCHCFLIEAVSEHNLHDFGSITLCQWPRSISDSFSLSSTPLLLLCDSFPEFRSYSFILKIKQKNVFSFQAVKSLLITSQITDMQKQNVCCVLYLYWEKQDTFQDFFVSCYFCFVLESIEMYLMAKTKNSD